MTPDDDTTDVIIKLDSVDGRIEAKNQIFTEGVLDIRVRLD